MLGVRPSFATGFAHSAGESEYPELWKGLVGFWPIFLGQTGGIVKDWSGNQSYYSGALVGGVSWKSGKSGSSLYFDGSDDYVKLQLWNGGNIVTLVARVRFEEAIGSIETITGCWSDFGGGRSFRFSRTSGGKLTLSLDTNNGLKTVNGGTTLTTGKWWDLAVVNDGINGYVYVNGVSDATPLATGLMDTSSGAWAIGAYFRKNDWTDFQRPFEGRIEFLMRYDRALSAGEIAFLAQNPTALVQLRRRVVMVSVGEVPAAGVMAAHYYKRLLAGVA